MWPDTRVSATQEVVVSSASYRWWVEGGANGVCGELARAHVVGVNRCAFEPALNPHLERMDSIALEKIKAHKTVTPTNALVRIKNEK